MKKIFTKKSFGLRLVCILFCVILAVAMFIYRNSLFQFSHTEQYETESSTIEISNQKNVGKIESIIEYGDRVNITVHYPVVGNGTIDKNILQTIEQQINEFRNEIVSNENYRGDLYIDYDSYIVDNKYISIAVNCVKSMSFQASTEELAENKVFDISSGHQLSITDVIDQNNMTKFIDVVSERIENTYDYNDEELKDNIKEFLVNNVYDFYFDNEGMVVRFDKYSILPGYMGVPSVKLKYDELQSMYKSGFNANFANNTMDMQKNVNDSDKPIQSASIRKVDPNKPMVAITFDDGPHPEYTREILKALQKYNGAATFYVLGKRATVYNDVIQEIMNSGSEVGNHSWAHANYTNLDGDGIKKDKNKTQSAVKEIIGKAPATMRVPYGAINSTVESNIEMPVILWSIDTNDWKDKETAIIVKRATENVKDGDIILMHDIWKETATAVPDILKELDRKGFQIVTVSEMAEAKGITLKNGQKYFSLRK